MKNYGYLIKFYVIIKISYKICTIVFIVLQQLKGKIHKTIYLLYTSY